ncbi:uncharacterized protein LOC129945995 isoform X2 [Eupeodes corollae]|uniref:uncharacterized protein LOC129945995 isoform X2 n=1 Tax=Eupeodes corollae TaxID=290404 RepID=UPI0024928DB0|nr:uncharacterized protein LOC129945995 isoform X2 [Eupeodes corollae]
MFEKDSLKVEDVFSFSYNSSPETQNRDQWRKVLGTFELVKDKTLVTAVKSGKKSIQNKKKYEQNKKARNFGKKTTPNLTNTTSKLNSSQCNIMDSEIVWSSSNEESDGCVGIAISRYNLKNDHHEIDFTCSSSNESENEENKSLAQNRRVTHREQYLKRTLQDSEINWSSSNESETEGNSSQKIRPNDDSYCELDSFVNEIEKDLRRTKKIKQKCTTKKGGFSESFRKAINKAKADTGFLDYEQRTEIICGSNGVIVEREESYGTCLAKVQIEGSSNCYILLGKKMLSSNKESVIVCFLDESHRYTVNDKNVYVQPNKVIKAHK